MYLVGIAEKEFTIDVKTSHHNTKTVCLPSRLAVFAGVADILDRLEPCSLANLEVLNSFSDFDNDTCAFVAGALSTKLSPADG